MLMKRKAFHSSGFTLIELVVVVTMMGILLSLAVPSFVAMQRSSAAAMLGNKFAMAIGFARSEAIATNKCVTVCAPADITVADPVCTQRGREWSGGWIVFSNPKCDSVATDDTARLLKFYIGRTGGPTLTAPTGKVATLRFDARGRSSLAGQQALDLAPAGGSATKVVCLDMMGRARVGNVGGISCNDSNQN
ncbi:type IV fimbrial biogenesis protein FimT [Variovorax paradoxus]|uniref:GspH/FimT family pseudopilin n=1 Tax=Variovorax atrisoli TaxID=3394203 RepID=UPI00119ACC12|nr:GspH/FimT family pseudopilin [Variovorax paradoxus]MDR6520261.1 type IV fimbrial biogenesis protein FimT [Variovorax paradoxus]